MLEQVCKLAKEVGNAIMDIYHADTPVQIEKNPMIPR